MRLRAPTHEPEQVARHGRAGRTRRRAPGSTLDDSRSRLRLPPGDTRTAEAPLRPDPASFDSEPYAATASTVAGRLPMRKPSDELWLARPGESAHRPRMERGLPSRLSRSAQGPTGRTSPDDLISVSRLLPITDHDSQPTPRIQLPLPRPPSPADHPPASYHDLTTTPTISIYLPPPRIATRVPGQQQTKPSRPRTLRRLGERPLRVARSADKHRGLDVRVTHPLLDPADVRFGDHASAEGMAQVMKAK